MNIFDRMLEKKASYGPLSAKPHTPDPLTGYEHRVGDVEDDGGASCTSHAGRCVRA